MSNAKGITTDLNDNEIEVRAISETSYGEPAGIFGINCHHSAMPFIPGLSIIRGEVPDEEENKKAYALTQEQRRLERAVRNAKRDAVAADAIGDEYAFEKAAIKIKDANAQLDGFLAANKLNASIGRTDAYGFDRIAKKASDVQLPDNI